MALAAQAPPGNLVGHYRILGQVGAGGMGVVFKAYDTQLERVVALKFLTPDPSCSFADRDRLLREARAASTLDHKNIANIHAVEETGDGQLFIVMAFYEGESLAARMRRAGFASAEAVDTVRQIAQGLEHAHLHNLVHRDIKPSNVIVTVEGEVKIVDFGLARFVSADASTQSLSLAGTLAYMSPEQVAGKAVDARTDIWSLGVIAYQLLTDRLPFRGDNPAATISAILRSSPAPIENVPGELQLILLRALSKHVGTRYQSCTELLRDLEAVEVQFQRGVSLETGRRTRFDLALRRLGLSRLARRAPWIWAVLLALGLGMGGIFTWILTPAKQMAAAGSANPAAYESYLHGLDSFQRYDKPDRLNAAIASFERTVKADPRFALAFAALGEAYWNKYKLDQDPKWIEAATTVCKRAAELNDQLPAVYVTLGRIHDGTGRHDLAFQEFQRALELDHRNADALLGLADAYANADRNQEAEETYKRAAAMRPEYWGGHYRLGAFYHRRGRFAEAASQFRKVIELLPDHASAHAALGLALMSMRQEGEAEAEFKKSLELAPDYTTYANLGALYYNQKRFAESATMTEKALRLNDKDYRLWNNLAVAYEWLGQSDLAKEAFGRELAQLEQAIRFKSEDAQAQADLGVMYSQQHLRKKAFTHLEAAAALAPEDADVLGKFGEAHENFGERAQAIEYFRRAFSRGWTMEDLESNPDLRALLAEPNARRVLRGALPPAIPPTASTTH